MANSLSFQIFGQDVSGSKALEGVANNAGKVGGKITSTFSKLSSTIGGEFGEVMGTVMEGFDGIGKHASAAAKVMAGGAAFTAVGAGLMQLGSGEQAAQQQLKAAVEASGHSWEDYESKIETAISSQQNFGHSSTDTQAALQKMTQATGDPAKALANMTLVSNLAAAGHMSLADAADKVDKVMAGKGGKTLAQYGISMKKNKDGTLDTAGAIEELSKKVEGQASAATDTFAGKVDSVKTKLGDWAAKMAGTVGPAVTALGPVMAIAGTAMELLAARKGAAVIADEALVVAEGEQATATEAATVASDGLNASLLLNPMVLIIALIVALVAAFVLAYQHVTWFHDGVNAAMSGVKVAIGWVVTAAGAVFNWAKSHWVLILAIFLGPIGLLLAFVITHFAAIKAVIGSVVGWFMTHVAPVIGKAVGVIVAYYRLIWAAVSFVFNSVKTVIGAVWGWITSTAVPQIRGAIGLVVAVFKTISTTVSGIYTSVTGWIGKIVTFAAGLPGKIGSAVAGMWNGIASGFRGVINQVIGWWDGLSFSIPSVSLGGVTIGGGTIHMPYVHPMAQGGIVKAGHGGIFAHIGEGAYDEAVIPLRGGSGGLGGGGDLHIHLPQGAYVSNATQFQDILVKALETASGRGVRPRIKLGTS